MLGWCLADADPFNIIDYGVIKFNYKQDINNKLYHVFTSLLELMRNNDPDILGIENVFIHVHSMASAFAMQGTKTAVILAFINHYRKKYNDDNAPIHKIAATSIKKQLTGKGHASKELVAEHIHRKLGLNVEGIPADATDAIAVAWATHRLILENAGNPGVS